ARSGSGAHGHVRRRPSGRSVRVPGRRRAVRPPRGHGIAPAGGTPMNRLVVVAREEYRRALESRWLFGFTILFAALVLGLSYFGLAQHREAGLQRFARVAPSLIEL